LEEGYTPSVIDVRVRADGKRNVSSVWVRAERKSQDLSERADSIAALAISLAYCGQPDALMDGLRDKWGRSVRTAIIARAPAILAPRTIVDWFQTETIPSQQAAIMEMLGSIAWSRFDDTSRKFLQARATDLATTSPDARLNGTARWCCRAWSLAIADPVPNIPLDPMRNWFTNSQGQPFVRLVVPDLVVAGKPGKGRMWKQVGRTIAMATTEATGEQFQDFLADPQVRKWINSDPSTRQIGVDQASMPQRKVSWEMAVRFCQWLNEKESVPEDQWCYKEVWSSETDLQPTLNYLQKGGYRLPTQHEWKYACAAGSTEAWHFGSDQDACAMYEWTLPHSGNRTHAVATLRPNGFGLFDMGGNLAEWCDNAYREPIRSVEHYFAQDDGNPSNRPMSQNRLLAGGRFRFGAQSAISDSMVLDASDYLSVSTGFRVVKTIAEPDRIIKE
jgi:formylglycine-generating enzyme required for sulfatase activity